MCVVYLSIPVGTLPEGDEPKFQLQRTWLISPSSARSVSAFVCVTFGHTNHADANAGREVDTMVPMIRMKSQCGLGA